MLKEENKENSLRDMYEMHEGYVSDKWELYLKEYSKLFEKFRDKPIALLEIGVQNGGSLEIWSKYFHKDSILIGIDIEEKCRYLKYNNSNIKVIIGDATKSEILEIIKNESGIDYFDIIIDDGSHKSRDIITTFCNLFPILKIGGIYIIEDLHCSYFKEYEGGLQKSSSSIEFFKNLIDVINYEHWRLNIPRSQILKDFFHLYSTSLNDIELAKIHSIKFLNSLCIIEKEDPINNRLGKRVVVGKYAVVSPTVNPNLLGDSLLSDVFFEGEYNPTKFELEQEKTSLQKKLEEVEDENDTTTNKTENSYDYQSWIKNFDTLMEDDVRKIKEHIERLSHKPLLSIIMPVYNTPEKFLRRAIESVINQLYPYWELCIVDDASTLPHVKEVLEEYRKKDKRIKVVYRETNGHISEASNTALEIATGEFIVLVDHDDEIPPHALYMVALEINRNPDANIIYSDEDKIDENGNRFDPYFKPDFNYLLFLGQNMIGHLGVYRTSLVKDLGGFRKGFEGAQDWDLALRIVEIVPEHTVRHIPFILYHRRVLERSTASGIQTKPYVREAQYKVVSEHLKRRDIEADLIDVNKAFWRVKFLLKNHSKKVSIIIPTKNKVELLYRCIESIFEKTSYKNFEIIVVDNRSDDHKTLEYLNKISKHPQIKVLRYNFPFNYSKINNYAVKFATGELLLFLNNDTEVINNDWLEELVSHAIRKEVGAVGTMLYYPNDTIQHAGVILGIGGVSGHAYRHFPKGHPGQFGRAWLPQYLSAVTGACLMTRKEIFQEIGGFDKKLEVGYNDIDLCLRIREKGYKIVWTPYAELYHYEGATRGIETIANPRVKREVWTMIERWGKMLYFDPAYNPNLTLDRLDFSLAFPPRVKKPWHEI
ncbi:glycosyltransferase family 2 protein [Caldisericum sp.]|uniref:glycosyltransferase family 2 protein n=1 Tax=Caldisericum sp. TaxID=2499687 RepID=UPI003D0D78A3